MSTRRLALFDLDNTLLAGASEGTRVELRGIVKDRPLTHDLIGHLLRAFGAGSATISKPKASHAVRAVSI